MTEVRLPGHPGMPVTVVEFPDAPPPMCGQSVEELPLPLVVDPDVLDWLPVDAEVAVVDVPLVVAANANPTEEMAATTEMAKIESASSFPRYVPRLNLLESKSFRFTSLRKIAPPR